MSKSAFVFISLIFTQLSVMNNRPWRISALKAPFCPQVLLYSEPDFGGECQVIDRNKEELSNRLLTKSCRVSGGRWEALTRFNESAGRLLKWLRHIKTGEVNISHSRSSWVLYGDKQFTGEVHVLSEGHYPNLTSMGCQPGFTARSVKVVPMVRESASPPCDYKPSLLRPLTPFFFFSFCPVSRFQSRPSPCSAWSAWRAERSPRRRRSSAWWRRDLTTTSCRSESTEAGECLRVCKSVFALQNITGWLSDFLRTVTFYL